MSTTRQVDVVGGGAAAVDTLLFVNAEFGDGKGRIRRQERRYGGNIAAALVASAREGARSSFLGYLPDDSTSDGLLEVLRAEDVDLTHARTSATINPIRSIITVDQHGNRFIAYDDRTDVGLPDDLDLDLVRAARVLLVDGYGVRAGLRAARAARDAGVAVIVDLERSDDPDVAELFDLADHLVLPEAMALTWTGQSNAADAVTALWRPDRAAVVVTAGAEGSWYYQGDQIKVQPATKVDVVDTTGCGDVFHGAYAAGLALGDDITTCVVRATHAAAQCATRPGSI